MDLDFALYTKYSIDRIDNDGDYYKENCRWATTEVQSLNKRNNHFLTFNGKTQTVIEWSKELGITYYVLLRRVNRGWSTERALTTN